MSRIRLSMVLLWALVLLAAWMAWVGAGTTSAAFESSEGRWSEREIPEEGYDFRRIRVSFEEFKQACGRPAATMVRTTQRNPFNVLAWWDYAMHPKWALPYRAARVAPVPNSQCAAP